MAGYSRTPLAKKLGVVPKVSVFVDGAPSTYRSLLAPLPQGVQFAGKAGATTDVLHLFVRERATLATSLARYRKIVKPDAAIWISWPKKASKVPTDITEDVIRALALPLGLVDVKVCAVDDVWSGLKLVIRKELREKKHS
jgi:hypothetical protein